MPKYELMLVVDPFMDDAEHAALVDKAQEQVKRRGGTVTNVDLWGKRRLAYTIEKKQEGYYTLISFDSNASGAELAEMERTLRLDEKTMRVMVTRIPEPKAPRKVKPKKPKAANQAGTEVQYGTGRGYGGGSETHSAGQAGAGAANR